MGGPVQHIYTSMAARLPSGLNSTRGNAPYFIPEHRQTSFQTNSNLLPLDTYLTIPLYPSEPGHPKPGCGYTAGFPEKASGMFAMIKLIKKLYFFSVKELDLSAHFWGREGVKSGKVVGGQSAGPPYSGHV